MGIYIDKSIDSVLAFSPGGYYKKRGKTFIEDSVKTLKIPVFITSAKDEKNTGGVSIMLYHQKRRYIIFLRPKECMEQKHSGRIIHLMKGIGKR